MPRTPDPLELRRQRALNQLQQSRVRLLMAVRQNDDDGAGPGPATDWWSRLQPLLGTALSALPWLSTALSLFRGATSAHAHVAPATAADNAHAGQAMQSPAHRPSIARLGQAARQHPLLSIGLAALGGTLLWHQRRSIQRLLAATVLPEVLASLSLHAAPWLAGCLQDLFATRPEEAAEPASEAVPSTSATAQATPGPAPAASPGH